MTIACIMHGKANWVSPYAGRLEGVFLIYPLVSLPCEHMHIPACYSSSTEMHGSTEDGSPGGSE